VSTKPLGNARMRRADLALLRGELETAAAFLAEANTAFGSYDPMAQHAIPLARIALGIAAAQGRIADARAELARAVDPGFPPGTQRYAWPLLAAAASVEADVRGLPSAEAGRAATLELIRAAAKRLPTTVPWCAAYALVVAAELDRAEGKDSAARWETAVVALQPLDRPHELARACQRWAAALLAEGGDRETIAALLRQARTESVRLGARPLSEQLELLARRARVPLTIPDAALPDEPADPAEALGLTSREQDVLRLVAAGHSNRQIAEELYISPKTASVHVSNILAKLGVSGRGEAAALAHRLNLFPARQAIEAAP
jgi:DNA-binding NarL/FixJ family response regulator